MGHRGDIFNTVEMRKPSYNRFDLSHDVKMSFNMGKLYPIYLEECVPGDRFNISCSQMLRFAPLIAPVMHKVNVWTHFFFVPNRIIWPPWETFIVGPDGPNPDAPPTMPYLTDFDVAEGSLFDYLGLPTHHYETERVNALPVAAYQAIYNEYFRDQNLIDPIDFVLADGNNTANLAVLSVLRDRAWEHDYFTSALPWAQKGDPVSFPISGFQDVAVVLNASTNAGRIQTKDGTIPTAGLHTLFVENDGTTSSGPMGEDDATDHYVRYNPNGTLSADTSSLTTTAVSINDLRRAEQLQVWLEKNARGGNRYTESNLVHFGVHSPDARLQRPEYIGGTKNPMVISEVLQTSKTETDAPQGNLAGHGISVGGGNGMSYYCQEHGWIIGLTSVLPVTAYFQGIPKMFSKSDPFDYYWREFANIGEQEIKNKEVFFADDPPDDDATFGYTPRYAEYKYRASRVSGEFRSSLLFWHLARSFADTQDLNDDFINADPSTRIFATIDATDKIWAHFFININASRLMPRFGTPTL